MPLWVSVGIGLVAWSIVVVIAGFGCGLLYCMAGALRSRAKPVIVEPLSEVR